VENRYAGLVRGSSAVFPRGYIWLIPLWYAVIAAVIEFKGHSPTWYLPIALGGLLVATMTLVVVLSTMRNNAFLAENGGIWLGLRGGARRKFTRRRRETRHLSWAEIAQIKIAWRRYGARVDIILPAYARGHRGRLVWRIAAAVLTVFLPPAYLFRNPGLVRPRSSDPMRYRIPLYDVSPEQLRLALVPMAPPNLPIAVQPRWRTRALRRLRRLRRSKLTTAA